MCLSRVRKTEDLCIVQPFSPNLFCYGELIGPHTFLEVHREKLTLAQAKIRFEKDKPNKQRNRDIMLFCRGCSPQPHLQEKLLPLREFVSAWDQEEWYRVLSDGMCRFCTQCKTKQSSPPAKGKPKEVGSCAYCQTRPADQTGYCSERATIRLAFSKCDIGKKIKTKRLVDFSPEEIRRRKRTKELRRARCKKCAVAPVTATAKQGLCSNCNKAISVSHLVNYSAASQTGVCRSCVAKQERAPKTCAKCSHPLHANATPGTWCIICAFPPCSGGCGRPRPQKASNHAKQKSDWYCQNCKGKCANCAGPLPSNAEAGTWGATCAYPPCSGGCGEPRPQRHANHAKYLAKWFCEHCNAAKQCANCAGPLPSNVQADTWCVTCAYPPCSGGCGAPRPQKTRYHAQQKPLWLCQACSVRNGYPPCPMCGLQRPQESRYHVKVMPHWTCEACTVKSCPKCGEVLGSKAQTGALCLACAYPPCASCGSQRPQESRYHVKVMPHWTCEACTVKSCPKCGEVLGSKAQTGALCLACAYPPCESCGSQRPQESRYRVNVMPQWTCEACSVKSCPKCGQILGPKAQDGAWCLACAYPPCESCGRPRPRTRCEYHAQVMPTWTCEACSGNSHTGVPKKRRRRG